MISSTQALGMPSTVASSVLAALRAGMTTITLASPLPAGVAGSVVSCVSSMRNGGAYPAPP